MSQEKLIEEQMYDGQWYALDEYPYETCCDCGLVHRVEGRIVNGKIELRAFREVAQTRLSRAKLRRAAARKKAGR